MPAVDSSTSALVKAVARGYAWRQQLLNGSARSTAEIAQKEGVTRRYVARLLRLGFPRPRHHCQHSRAPAAGATDRRPAARPHPLRLERAAPAVRVRRRRAREIAADERLQWSKTRAARTHMLGSRRQREPRALTPERAVRTLAETTPRRALRVEFPTQHLGQVADKFELSAAGNFLYKNRRLVGGGSSHQRTILHGNSLLSRENTGNFRDSGPYWL